MSDSPAPSPTVPLIVDPPPAARPTWHTWAEIILCSGYPTQIMLGGVLMAVGINAVGPDNSLSPRFVFALSLLDTVLLLSLIVALLVRRGERPLEVFFGGRPAFGEIAFGVMSVPVVLTVVLTLMVGIMRFAPQLRNVPNNPLEGLLSGPAGIWLFLFVAIVAGGVREELQRAFLLHRFKRDLDQPWMGLFITSMAFGLGHTLQGNDAAIITGMLGAIWGAMYLIRGSALASMVSHSLFNSAELLRIVLR
ncbi:MAG TPA: CPBP family intramembrane glutamic endopeptidase [Vicinamibacterales bacterium]|nr:CPBP family intramembrane glutamic endopeptidase [Vicinamibacterales bacterium]